MSRVSEAVNFGEALAWLKRGYKAERVGWNGKGMSIEMQSPDANSKMGRPYLFINDAQGLRVPWAPSQTDILAEDWNVIE